MIWADALVVRFREYLGWKPRKEVIDTIGNMSFWYVADQDTLQVNIAKHFDRLLRYRFNFCIVGQPFIVMLYYFDYQRKNSRI